jgi:hypothetical protein
MIATLLQIASIGALIIGVKYCGKKFLLIIPGTIIPAVIGVVTNIVLWEAAHGQYEDSDTLIFGAPRVPGSADSWFKPVESALGFAFVLVACAIVAYAVWPKNRPAFRFQKRSSIRP